MPKIIKKSSPLRTDGPTEHRKASSLKRIVPTCQRMVRNPRKLREAVAKMKRRAELLNVTSVLILLR